MTMSDVQLLGIRCSSQFNDWSLYLRNRKHFQEREIAVGPFSFFTLSKISSSPKLSRVFL